MNGHSDFSKRKVLLLLFRYLDAEKAERVCGANLTIFVKHKLRASLAQSLKDQWAMEQQRRLELAALTHDLKTPLTVISGNAELLEEDALNPTH